MSNSMYPKLDPAFRKKTFGKKLAMRDIYNNTHKLLVGIGEMEEYGLTLDPDSFGPNRLRVIVEERLHELAHHAALEGVNFTFKKRKVSLTKALDGLGPGASEGQEMDTLAVELNAAWWLGWQFNERRHVSEAAENLSYFSKYTALKTVRALRVNGLGFDAGFKLAKAIAFPAISL